MHCPISSPSIGNLQIFCHSFYQFSHHGRSQPTSLRTPCSHICKAQRLLINPCLAPSRAKPSAQKPKGFSSKLFVENTFQLPYPFNGSLGSNKYGEMLWSQSLCPSQVSFFRGNSLINQPNLSALRRRAHHRPTRKEKKTLVCVREWAFYQAKV